MPTKQDLERALLEDSALARALAPDNRSSPVLTTPESVAAGDASIAAAYSLAPALFQERVDAGELLTADEFCDVLGVQVDWLDDALREGRVFSMSAPSGRAYYPGFYADARLNRADLERVCQLLRALDPVSQFSFFERNWTPLSARTPLEALRSGELENVVRTAIGYADDAPARALPK